MPDVLIRRAVSGDLPVLTQLWAEVFGDSSEMIAAFFRYFPPEQSGWVVCSGTQICSAAYLLTGNQLVSAAGSCDCAYVYAVATPAPQRGHGYASLLMRHFSSLAHTQRLALYTLPAERGLYDWYRDIMGASVISYGTEQAVQACPSDADVLIRPTSPDCYGAARERQLAAQPHLALSKPFLSLAEEYCRMAGGGLFLLDTPDGPGCCAAEPDCSTLRLKELLVPTYQQDAAVQALLRRFRLNTAVIRRQGGKGAAQPFAAYQPLAFQEAAPKNWGLFLD